MLLALIQGVSEFIPVSSSAHLILFSNIINDYSNSVLMDTSLHLGSLIAIVHFFWKDLINYNNNKKILILIIIGSLPLIIFGYFIFNYNIYKIFAW